MIRTAEAPLLPQHAIEQPVIDVRGDTVDLVVGCHHASHMGFLDGRLKRHQEILADDSFGVVAGRGVGAALRHSMHGKVLGSGENVLAIDQIFIALEALDGGHADARGEIRIFAVGLFRAAPARVARNVEDR